MTRTTWRSVLASLLICLTLLISACSTKAPSPYEQVQQETTGRNAQGAVVKEAIAGGEFNQFFPASTRGLEVVPAQEKKGFAEYKLNRDGATLAVLSVSDILNNPTAGLKFQNATRQIAGYPAVDVGSNQTAILVGDRLQVKVQSRDAAFEASDREAWISKFDLQGLSRLATAAQSQRPVAKTAPTADRRLPVVEPGTKTAPQQPAGKLIPVPAGT